MCSSDLGYSGVLVERWAVRVLDSTKSVHMNSSGSTDTRYRADMDGSLVVNDRGMGNGDIYVYADPTTGALIGWTWSTNQSTPYQGTDSLAANYRPILAGRLTGSAI